MSSSKELEITEGEPRRQATKVYMAVFSDEDGDESVVQLVASEEVRLPLVALDDRALEVLRKFSQQTADESGQTVSIICFTSRAVYESFRPSATGD